MNKLITKIVGVALGAAMTIGVGVAVASNKEAIPVHAGEEVYKQVTFSATNANTNLSSYTASGSYTQSSFTVNIQNFNNNSKKWTNIRCGRKSTASVATIINDAAIDAAISKVEITVDSISASDVNSIKLYTSSNNSTWTAESTQYSLATGAQSVSLASPAANLYYKVEFDCANTNTSTNGFVQISAIKYYYQNAGPSLSVSPTSAIIAKNGTQTLTATASGGSGSVSWVSSDTDVVTVSAATGTSITATGAGRGTATVTASYSTASDVEIPIQVTDVQHAGTSADPYTVEDARDQIDLNTGLTNVYVTGTVSEIVEAYNSTYHNISYNISTDGLTTSEQLEAYRGKGISGADFSSADDIQVGDEVVVYGTLKKFNSTYEFDSGNQLYSLNRPVPTTYDITATITNGTSDAPATIVENGSVDITITPSIGYKLPTNVSVTGATYTYSAGVISLSNPTDDVVISATCPAATSYSITVTESHCSHTGASSIYEESTATLTFTADSGYELPSSITVTGATVQSYTKATGVLILENPTASATMTVTATELTYDNTTNLTPGNYYLAFDDSGTTRYMTGISSSEGTTSTTQADGLVFTFALVDDDTWTIMNDGKYLRITGINSKNLALDSTYGSFTIDWFDSSDHSAGRKLTSVEQSARSLAKYNSGIRTYANANATAFELITAKTVSGFSVYSTGANKNVLKGSTFDAAAAAAAGFEARLNYTDSTFDDVTALATWTLDTSTTGTKTLTVTYLSYTDTSVTDMNVYVVTITSLTIDSTGAKTTGYWTGDTLNTSGLVITGHDSSANDYSIAVEDCTFSPTTLMTAGDSITITATYTNDDESTAIGTYTVSVTAYAYQLASSINGGDRIIFATTETYSSYLSSVADSKGNVTTYAGKPGTEYYFDVVAGVNDETVAFKDPTGKYLNGATVKALSLSDDVTEATSWTVEFDENIPTITNVSNTNNVLKYNTSSPRICTYANTSGVFMNIYKLIGTSGQSAAETWATSFNTDVVNGVCKVNGSDFSTAMPTAWNAKATTYAALSSEAKSYIASKTPNASGDVVEKALYEYNHIYSTYGTTLELDNYIGRTEPVKAAKVINPINPVINNNNFTAIIVIISMVSLTAIGGYFFLKRRKESN